MNKKSEYYKLLKILKNHFSERFEKTVELLQSKILTFEDVKYFCENEPTVAYVIEELKIKKEDELKKQSNKAILARDTSLIDISLINVEKEKAVLSDEFARLMLSEPASPEEALQKQINLNNLTDRIKACDIIYNDLQNCKTKNFKSAKGRPRKKENKDLVDLVQDFKKSELDEKQIDKDIACNLKNLLVDEKQYLLNYIQKMIQIRTEIK